MGVLDQGAQVLGLRGVDDVEEELAVRQVGVGLMLGVRTWQVWAAPLRP